MTIQRSLNLHHKVSALRLMFCLLLSVLISACNSAKIPPSPAPSDNQLLVSQFTEGGLIAKETERGVVIYLPSVMFVVGSAKISDPAKDKVRFIAEICNNDIARDRNIMIEGHTDSKGSEKYNMKLSEQRAIAVSELLRKYHLNSERIDADWFGETRPLVPNQLSDGSDNPEGRRTNRRVEFILLNPAS